MQNLNPEILQKFQMALKNPTGTLSFKYTFDQDIFSPKAPSGIILEVISGAKYIRLEKEDHPKISFYYSVPGIGTKVATIDLKTINPSKVLLFFLTWSVEEINLYVGSITSGGNLTSATGVKSEKKFRIDKSGTVVQIGDKNLEVMDTRITSNEIQILTPTAIETWQNTKMAIEILQTGKSDQGYIFEVIKANFTLVMLVTGFETYCKTRFQEVELEGKEINWKKLDKKGFSKEEILNPTANYFQNFDTAKNIFKLGLEIKFGDIFSSHKIENIKKIFKFRHRIVHTDPLLTMINEFEINKNEPIFSTKIAKPSIIKFHEFIEKLHNETLK